MNEKFFQEVLGSMRQFLPLTPEVVALASEDKMTFEWLECYLQKFGLSADKVVYDPSRSHQNIYYADYERGLYAELYLQHKYLEAGGRKVLEHLAGMRKNGNPNLQTQDWSSFYIENVPIPMRIYDFTRRVREIDAAQVFTIWYKIYKCMNYGHETWNNEVLEYVFAHAPTGEKPKADENGLVRLYRGMGELSQPPEKAISWSTHPGNALWFANHSGRGTHLITAEVALDDIIAYFPGFYNENEVLVRPGTVRNICYGDMLPANQQTFMKLSCPILPEFLVFAKQAVKFGYRKEFLFEHHGLGHILRVLLLSLIYAHNSPDRLLAGDKGVLIYFSLLHDIGRTNEHKDDGHGAASVKLIQDKNLRVKGLHLTKKEYRIANLIIKYHCREDIEGIAAINRLSGFSRADKDRAVHLYQIAKDIDGLDRVRFNGLDPRLLRTPFARRLPLISGCLLKEKLADFCLALEADQT